MTWGVSLLSDTQRTLVSQLLLWDSETTMNSATFIVNLCVLNTIPEEKHYCVDVLESDNPEGILGIEQTDTPFY